VPILVKAGVLDGARPLFIPPKGPGRGKVMRVCVACSGRRGERSWWTTRFGVCPRARVALLGRGSWVLVSWAARVANLLMS
jgi:hypothetical protein